MNLPKRDDPKNPPIYINTKNYIPRSKDPESPSQSKPKLRLKIPKSLPNSEPTPRISDPPKTPRVTALSLVKKFTSKTPTAHSKGYEKKPSIFYQKDIAENLRKNLHFKAKLPSRKFPKPSSANNKKIDDEGLMFNREGGSPVDEEKILVKDSPCLVNPHPPVKLRIVRPGHGCFIVEPVREGQAEVRLELSE